MEILECIYDSRKSFYGKAKINFYNDDEVEKAELLSYGTLVAQKIFYKKAKNYVYEYFGKYSQTTTRHQKEFFKQCGLNDKEIKKLFENGSLEREW